MRVTVQDLVRDEGSVVVFVGTDDEGRRLTFACDHRAAEDIVAALLEDLFDVVLGETPGVPVEIEPWQVLFTSDRR